MPQRVRNILDYIPVNGLLGARTLANNWKWIRLHDDIYYELKDIGHFGDSFSDILRRLLDNYYSEGGPKARPNGVSKDEIKARLKKFDSHTKAISRLVKENISYSEK